jgi:hypothetical protein
VGEKEITRRMLLEYLKKQNIVKSAQTTKTLIQDVTPDDYQSAQAGSTV